MPVRYSIFATGLLHLPLPTILKQSSVAGNVKVAQLPAGTDGNEQYNCNGGWNIGVSAYSSHKEEAKLLVKYWTSDDAMLIGATMSGKMPARPALYENKDLLAADSGYGKTI